MMERDFTAEFERIMYRMARSKGSGTRKAGLVTLALGALLIVAGYLTKYLFFELDALVALLLGLVLLFKETEPYVRADVSRESVASMYSTLSELLPNDPETNRVVYLLADEAGTRSVMLSRADDLHQSGQASIKQGSERGVRITPPGRGLFHVIDAEIGGAELKGIGFLTNALPSVIADALKLAESVAFKQEDDVIQMIVTDPLFREVFEGNSGVAARMLGCPVCSAVAELLVFATEKDVEFECQYDSVNKVVSGKYILIQPVKKAGGTQSA